MNSDDIYDIFWALENSSNTHIERVLEKLKVQYFKYRNLSALMYHRFHKFTWIVFGWHHMLCLDEPFYLHIKLSFVYNAHINEMHDIYKS